MEIIEKTKTWLFAMIVLVENKDGYFSCSTKWKKIFTLSEWESHRISRTTERVDFLLKSVVFSMLIVTADTQDW